MRYSIFLWAILGQWAFLQAQTIPEVDPTPSTLRVGYSWALSYNLYSWYRAPNREQQSERRPYSTGQAMNLLPGLSLGFWLGDVEHGLFSLETEINFLPFAVSVQQYQGIGVLEIPTLLKYQFPLSRQQSLWTFLHVGAGVQWQYLDLYDRAAQSQYERRYLTWIGEIGWHLSAVAHQKHRLRELEYFIRFGVGQTTAISLNTGLRLRFRNGTR